jgi:tRNA(Ile)-lysidine synthase
MMKDTGISAVDKLTQAIGEFFGRHPGIDPKKSIAAYSGGIDSSCLLDALVVMGRKPARAVYVNHNLRSPKELDREMAELRAFCADRGVALTIATVRPGAVLSLARDRGVGVEAAAREFRYKILFREAAKLGCCAVLTAHQEDDLLETLLFRIFRGSSAKGLGGMAETRTLGPVRGRGIDLARPLLAAPRSIIEAYAAERGMSFVLDSTNAQDDYARNRLRHRLVPVLDSSFPGWRRGLLGTSSALAADASALEDAVDAMLGGGDEKSPSVAMADFMEAGPELRRKIVGRLMVRSGSKAAFSRGALASASESLSGGARELRCYDRRFKVSGERLECLPALDFRPERGYFFMMSSQGGQSVGGVELRALWSNPGEDADQTTDLVPGKGFLAEGSFEFPLVVRTRMPGDRIRTQQGSTMVDELLKAWRIEPSLRGSVPVVEDPRGIVAVLPGAMEHPPTEREMHRHYTGPLSGRRFFIRVKGV